MKGIRHELASLLIEQVLEYEVEIHHRNFMPRDTLEVFSLSHS